MIISGNQADAEIEQVQAVEATDAGLKPFSYLALTDEDFERLAFSLFKSSQPADVTRSWDNTALMVRGADAGRDVLLTCGERPSGVVQCKRLETGMTLPAAFREIAKLILFAKVNGDLSFDQEVDYFLFLARDPAGTVVNFFARKGVLQDENLRDLRAAAREVREAYTSLASIEETEAESEVERAYAKLKVGLLRPTDLDEWLHREPSVSLRFFRQRVLVDNTDMLAANREMMMLLQAISGKVDGVPLLTDVDLKLIQKQIVDTPETHRLNLGIATLFGYPREMFLDRNDLQARLGRLGAALNEINGDYINWIFKRANDLAAEICNSPEVLFKVRPFARQIPSAFLGEIAKQCSSMSLHGSVVRGIISETEPSLADDDARLGHVRTILIEAGKRYLVGDFSELMGDAELVALKRTIIDALMMGMTREEDLEKAFDEGAAVLRPLLDPAAAKMRSLYSHPTSIFLTGSKGIDLKDFVGRMADTVKALDEMRNEPSKQPNVDDN
ncbi:hypothetical protein [Agrobacterium tumefaciens]|uniref:Uncharacterized protein n=1 Tax=Agrobacterium tumefaciens TaxID=358 RepID=A0AA44F2U6_AGRTU|nr:hypothetical protein [Agrobacterium tumefaciens]NSL21637.1 hypothetical protein [Agrobacterium tumefaciens]NTC16630.1 hypothetical protein [Agrobacterium tumefaciens]NTC28050.1 hypothetical protein [Agrobacterium tumefaciens]NTC58222.1 hypothetical protein [Agrobacterium tumefaciens]NTC60212.1 hypothetical protein [Agrobacterium tumefaciens]